jgi:5-oxoprolinase (ATP-hydrolysing) subunit C
VIEIVSIAGLATVQDGGRPGHMHHGVPPGGPLVPELLGRANVAVHNAPSEAAIEAFGAVTLVARAPVVLASDDGEARHLGAGETYALRPEKTAVRYVALRGGIDVPVVFGARGTLLVAALGGYEGRPLRRGDRLRAGEAPPEHRPPGAPVDTALPVRVVLGPDLDRFDATTTDAFLASTFMIDTRSDRVGTRLAGARLVCPPDPAAPSAPMIRGAIQVPPSGEPIVLGPDHPTTGGYPVIATVVRRHIGPLAARAIGATVRFVT